MLEHITQTECDEFGCSDIKIVALHTHFKELRFSEDLAFDCGLKEKWPANFRTGPDDIVPSDMPAAFWVTEGAVRRGREALNRGRLILAGLSPLTP